MVSLYGLEGLGLGMRVWGLVRDYNSTPPQVLPPGFKELIRIIFRV